MSQTPEENVVETIEETAEEVVEIVEEVVEAAAEAVAEVVEEIAEAIAEDIDEIVEEIAGSDETAAVTPATGSASAVGRRKEAVARVRIAPGSGQYSVNGRSLEVYFPDKVHQQSINSPFAVLGSLDQYDVVARIDGGGISGQAGALRLAIARSLNEINAEAFRADLKSAGYLERDARAKERKKYGLKKARKAPQYSKR